MNSSRVYLSAAAMESNCLFYDSERFVLLKESSRKPHYCKAPLFPDRVRAAVNRTMYGKSVRQPEACLLGLHFNHPCPPMPEPGRQSIIDTSADAVYFSAHIHCSFSKLSSAQFLHTLPPSTSASSYRTDLSAFAIPRTSRREAVLQKKLAQCRRGRRCY